ncbi:MAG: SDR family NAD(P)-dependent oxidoreductase [Deltaproteobacteria bacterium]|nr:SDR family NAD(P)-dependent oxidoreductase [Deltaproteobacteria bacterium]
MALDLDSIGKKIGPLTKDYDWRDVVLYALGVGAGFDDLEYCYEDKLKVIPSFSIGAVFDFLAQAAIGSNANLAGILHGEQEIVFHNAIPTDGTLSSTGAITNIYDKGDNKGALVLAEADTVHSNGQKLFTNYFTLFCRKDGGFGGDPAPKEDFDFPERQPDFEEDAQPSGDQPLIYRLSGDIFALHVNPDFAKASGFEKPIMHGLCTHGYTCRAVVKHLFPGQPELMTRFKVRFSRTLYPGVPIKTQIWKISEGKAVFRTLNADSGEVVIDRGEVEWISQAEAKIRASRTGIRFDDQVAIVTGAGAGLGRVYALELAKRGAKVVVNDLGGTTDGSGSGQGPADEVVAQIKDQGGEAVASYANVATEEGGRAIVDTAVQAFGRLDILINNAGILRDKTLAKMEPAAWDSVLAVHLVGAYNVTRPALQKMKETNYGRIIMTTSAAGLFGNFGQTNYSAAKLGLVGFMNTLKLESEKYNVLVNTVAPVAATRLTEELLPPDLTDKLKPEFIAPLVLFLSSEQCPTSGGIYNAGMGHFSRAAIVTGPGVVVGKDGQVPEPEAVAASMSAICSIDQAQEFETATLFLGSMLDAFSQKDSSQASGSKPAKLSVAKIFAKMPDAFNADKAAGVDVVFQYCISGSDGGDWFVTIKDGTCAVEQGKHQAPTTTIKMSAEDFSAMIMGKLNAMQAYTSGKLKIEGDLMKSQLIEKLFNF